MYRFGRRRAWISQTIKIRKKNQYLINWIELKWMTRIFFLLKKKIHCRITARIIFRQRVCRALLWTPLNPQFPFPIDWFPVLCPWLFTPLSSNARVCVKCRQKCFIGVERSGNVSRVCLYVSQYIRFYIYFFLVQNPIILTRIRD